METSPEHVNCAFTETFTGPAHNWSLARLMWAPWYRLYEQMVFTKLECKGGFYQFSLNETDNYFHFNISCVVSWIHLIVWCYTVMVKWVLRATKIPGAHFTLEAKIGERRFVVGVSWTAGSWSPGKAAVTLILLPPHFLSIEKKAARGRNTIFQPCSFLCFLLLSFYCVCKKPVF